MSVCAKAKLLPPSAIPDDFIGNEFRNTAIAFAVVETCLVALRYYARYLGKAPLGADDFLLPFALLFAYGQEGIGIAMVKSGGVGRRAVWNCIHQPWVFPIFAKLQISNILTLAIAIALAKITILNLFLRIFVQRSFRIATYVVIGIQIASMLTVVIVGVTQCTPLAFIWEPQKHPNGHCIDKNTFWRWGNFPQIITDVCILVLPIPALWQLKLSKRDKFGVILTFCTGGIGLVTSIVRFYMFYKIDGQADAGWQAVPLGSISIAETGAYVIAACLPIYRSLFRRAVGQFGASFGSRGSKGVKYGSNKSTELRSMGKSEKGFARIQHDELASGTFTKSRGSETSEERLTYPSGRTEIQVERSYVVSSHQV